VFNQPLDFDTSKVTARGFQSMFMEARAFDQELNWEERIPSEETYYMFYGTACYTSKEDWTKSC